MRWEGNSIYCCIANIAKPSETFANWFLTKAYFVFQQILFPESHLGSRSMCEQIYKLQKLNSIHRPEWNLAASHGVDAKQG